MFRVTVCSCEVRPVLLRCEHFLFFRQVIIRVSQDNVSRPFSFFRMKLSPRSTAAFCSTRRFPDWRRSSLSRRCALPVIRPHPLGGDSSRTSKVCFRCRTPPSFCAPLFPRRQDVHIFRPPLRSDGSPDRRGVEHQYQRLPDPPLPHLENGFGGGGDAFQLCSVL